jgi:hypothetical protein
MGSATMRVPRVRWVMLAPRETMVPVASWPEEYQKQLEDELEWNRVVYRV